MEIKNIKGISDKREIEFNKMGIFDTADLIKCFPRRYLDLRERQHLSAVYHNDFALTVGTVVSMPQNYITARRGFVKVYCEQEGLPFTAIWFNQPYVLSKLTPGEKYLFYGRVRKSFDEISIVNPTFELLDKNYNLKGIIPQYTVKGTIPQKLMRTSARLAVNIEKPKSIIPKLLLDKYKLSDLYTAYVNVHNPKTIEDNVSASERIAIEEYFALISAFKFVKGAREQVRINKYTTTRSDINDFISHFPFEFTDGQKNALNDIYNDLSGVTIMNRLMQGDVGSGKTAVSLVAIYIAVKSGFQASMLAPTEVLAKQNYEIVKKYFPFNRVAILTGSTTKSEKNSVKKALKNGEIDVLVGTHAILQDDVEFSNLSLCVCDEQQRFGVAQRSALVNKGNIPDVLVMSATPIPRTLSLIFFGDLDITTISDKPKERIPIQTNVVKKEKYADMINYIRREVLSGKQAYFVCPKVEGDEEGEIMSVTELYDSLSERLTDVKFALLHGKMKDKEKTEVMERFKNREIDCLVSTTVIEVGIDVPNASIMVIHNAERFGLSQLHQLRGRVGRSDIKSYCFLLSDSETPTAIERLSLIASTNDGFKISEYDYDLRGGGDFLGVRQSGKLMTDLGNLKYSPGAIFTAKKISDEFFSLGLDTSIIKEVAMSKYHKLEEITMN
ncbi:MAG: ATP-dependent DNA helicase RecG [Clostridia bacterium]|nr:ATP-dependent DNA helicase RecG [Clostridia bacterium]